MNLDRDSQSSPNPREDLFDAWLDAMVTGMSTPETAALAGNSSRHRLDRVTSAAVQFHGLAQAADSFKPEPSHSSTLEDFMQTAVPAPSRAFPRPATTWPRPDSRRANTVQAWASYALVAIVVAGLTLGIGRATNFFDTSTHPPTDENIIPFSGYVDGEGTPVPMGESSSVPYPNSANCTINPLTRDEVVAHLEAANVASEPVYEYYQRSIVPNAEDARAIMETYRMFQACSIVSRPLAYALVLETPWYTAQFGQVEAGRVVWGVQTLSDSQVQELADIALSNGGYVPSATPSDEQMEIWQATEQAAQPEITVVPLPEDATPFARPAGEYIPTIMATEIQIVGPDIAVANVVTVNAETGEVLAFTDVVSLRFVKVDGIWLIDQFMDRSQRG